MKRSVSILLTFLLMLNVMFSGISVYAAETSENSVVFYVAPDGDDTNDGTIDAPLASLKGARDRVRSYKQAYGYPEGGITVYFRDGIYKITETIDFDEQDSGTKESPIVYKAYPNEKPVFSGGYYVKGSEFVPVTDENILQRFPTEEARKNIVQYDLKANGITEEEWGTIPTVCGTSKDVNREGFGVKISTMEAFIDDDLLELARYPNSTGFDGNPDEGWTYVDKIIDVGAATTWYTGVYPKFTYTDTRIETWDSYEDIHVWGFFSWQYHDDNVQVKTINKEQKTIRLSEMPVHGVLFEGTRYFFYNVLDELDVPGEYYIDRTNGIIYLYPTKNMADATVKLSAFGEEAMVETSGLSHCTFSGLTFELTRGSIFRIVGGDSVVLSRCTLKNLGVRAVWMGNSHAAEGAVDRALDLEGELAKCYDNEANGINHRVTSCEMYNLGYGGVRMVGGDIYRAKDANFTVENCRIYNLGHRSKGYNNAVNYYGRGFTIRNNEIFNAPNGAMQGQAMNTVIEYNEMYNVVRETSDAGAIYTNYTWPVHDLYIRYNYIHDVPDSDFPLQWTYWDGAVPMKAGIYTDTEMWAPNIYGNVIANVPLGYFHSGRAEKIENNIFIDCQLAYGPWIDTAALTGWEGKEIFEISNGNLKYTQYFPWYSDIWKNEYPEFLEEFDEWQAMEDASDLKIYAVRNLLVYDKLLECYEVNLPEQRLRFTDSEEFIYEDNIVTKEDPGFVDMENGNYQLKDDAPFYDLVPDFERLDLSKVGTVTDVVGVELEEEVVTAQVTAAVGGEEAETCTSKN